MLEYIVELCGQTSLTSYTECRAYSSNVSEHWCVKLFMLRCVKLFMLHCVNRPVLSPPHFPHIRFHLVSALRLCYRHSWHRTRKAEFSFYMLEMNFPFILGSILCGNLQPCSSLWTLPSLSASLSRTQWAISLSFSSEPFISSVWERRRNLIDIVTSHSMQMFRLLLYFCLYTLFIYIYSWRMSEQCLLDVNLKLIIAI